MTSVDPLSSTRVHNNHEWNEVRASIMDACHQLGALDENSLISEWMFNDPTGERRTPRVRGTRFQEILSALPEDEEDDKCSENDRASHLRGWFPFTLFSRGNKTSAWPTKQTSPHTVKYLGMTSHHNGSGGAVEEVENADVRRTEGRSPFFGRRSTTKSSKFKGVEQTIPCIQRATRSRRQDSGYASVEPLSMSRPLPDGESDYSGEISPPAIFHPGSRSASGSTLAEVADEESDEDWDVGRNSPLQRLSNKRLDSQPICFTPEFTRTRDSRTETVQPGIFQALPRFFHPSRKYTPSPPSSPSASPAPSRKSPLLKWSKIPSPSPWPRNQSMTNKQINSFPDNIRSMRHGHTRSISLPSSPLTPAEFRPATTDSDPAERLRLPRASEGSGPQQASQVVFTDDAAVPKVAAYTHAMGYHHQFFENPITAQPSIARSRIRDGGFLETVAVIGSSPEKGMKTDAFASLKKG